MASEWNERRRKKKKKKKKKRRTGTKALSKVRSDNEVDRPRLGMREISSPPAAIPLAIAVYPLLLQYIGRNGRSTMDIYSRNERRSSFCS